MSRFYRPEETSGFPVTEQSPVRLTGKMPEMQKATSKDGFLHRGPEPPPFVTARRTGPHRKRGRATRSD